MIYLEFGEVNYNVQTIQHSIHYNPFIKKYTENVEMRLKVNNVKCDNDIDAITICEMAKIDVSKFKEWELIQGYFDELDEASLISNYNYIQ